MRSPIFIKQSEETTIGIEIWLAITMIEIEDLNKDSKMEQFEEKKHVVFFLFLFYFKGTTKEIQPWKMKESHYKNHNSEEKTCKFLCGKGKKEEERQKRDPLQMVVVTICHPCYVFLPFIGCIF